MARIKFYPHIVLRGTVMPQLALQLTVINGLSKHVLIQDMISSKLQDDKALKDGDIAKIAECSNHQFQHI